MKYVGDNAPVWSIGQSKRDPLFEQKDDQKGFFITANDEEAKKKPSEKIEAILKNRESKERVKFAPTFSKAARNILRTATAQAEKMPGVGSYDVGYYDLARNLYANRKGYRTARKVDRVSFAELRTSPGVGSYDLNHSTIAYRAVKGPGAHMAYRSEDVAPAVTDIGPGKYDVEYSIVEKATKPAVRQTCFSKAEKNLKWLLNNHETAGVMSAYQIPDSLDELRKPGSIKGSIAKSQRLDYIGPSKLTQYSKNDSQIEEDINWSYQSFIQRRLKGKGPTLLGKNTYNPSSSVDKNPGPGQYHIADEFSRGRKAVSMTKGERSNTVQNDFSKVGPGSYDVIVPKTNTGPVLVPPNRRRNRKRVEVSPGPAQYNPTLNASKAHCYSISHTERDPPKRTLKHLFAEPGPGTYHPSFDQISKNSPAVRIKQAESSNRLKSMGSDNLLGPAVGSYFIDDTLENSGSSVGISFTRAKRVRENTKISEVGPGKYDIKPTFPQIATYEEQRQKRVKTENASKLTLVSKHNQNSSQLSKL